MNLPRLFLAGLAAACLAATADRLQAQHSRVLPLPQVKNILKLTGDNWIAFHNHGDRQFIYFTHLVTWRCGMSEIRYSLHNDGLSERFPLPECDAQQPHVIVAGDTVHLSREPNSVHTVAVQILFSDGSASDINVYQPCSNDAEATCARRIETRAANE